MEKYVNAIDKIFAMPNADRTAKAYMSLGVIYTAQIDNSLTVDMSIMIAEYRDKKLVTLNNLTN